MRPIPLPTPLPMSCDLLMLMGKAPEWGTFENQTWLLSHTQGMNANLGLYFTCKSQCGWVFLFVLGINRVSDWIYAYLLIGSYLFKNLDPLLTQHLKKVNSHLRLIINGLKILNIHNWAQLEENNSVACLSKTWINNLFVIGGGHN